MFDLRFLKKALGWNFAFLSFLCIVLAFWIALRTLRLQLDRASSHPIALLIDAVFPVLAAVFGVAWWKIWKQRPYTGAWGIAASIVLTMLPVWRIIRFPRSIHGYTVLVLAVGIAGLVIFPMRDQIPPAAVDIDSEDNSS
jgi:hypothetical protein